VGAKGCRPVQGSTFLCGRAPGALTRADESQPVGLINPAQARESAPRERTVFPRSWRCFATIVVQVNMDSQLQKQEVDLERDGHVLMIDNNSREFTTR
jgi:hypothetical protein